MSSFYTILSQKFLDSAFLRQISEIGFLVQFESLLSSLGKLYSKYEDSQYLFLFILGDEIGMLEDMCVAVAELATVQFQVTVAIHFSVDVVLYAFMAQRSVITVYYNYYYKLRFSLQS